MDSFLRVTAVSWLSGAANCPWLSFQNPYRSVLPRVLLLPDSRSRGVWCGAIQLAGFCSDLLGFATKRAVLGRRASASVADGSRNAGESCVAVNAIAASVYACGVKTCVDFRPEYPREDSNL
jgi:hypothetical protein